LIKLFRQALQFLDIENIIILLKDFFEKIYHKGQVCKILENSDEQLFHSQQSFTV